jgi:hypothetical protein
MPGGASTVPAAKVPNTAAPSKVLFCGAATGAGHDRWSRPGSGTGGVQAMSDCVTMTPSTRGLVQSTLPAEIAADVVKSWSFGATFAAVTVTICIDHGGEQGDDHDDIYGDIEVDTGVFLTS